MSHSHQLKPGKTVRLADLSTEGKSFHPDRKDADKEFEKLRDEFIETQRRFYADGRQKLLIVLQGMDCGGKDGAIRHVFRGVNPQGVQVTSFKVPSTAERARDYLWRIHQAVPGNGMIGVFNRSHYEDVLVVRVDQLVPKEVWQRRYDQINEFERMLSDTGTRILKFYLHMSKQEQRKRLEARLEDKTKHWKFAVDDLAKRRQWDDYMAAYEDALNRCTTDWAPWHVIPADQKWYRNLAITRVIVAALREMKPEYPPAHDVSQIEIDD
jgi:PPK2 family polyphosphate:nucleotide phosphotransferase